MPPRSTPSAPPSRSVTLPNVPVVRALERGIAILRAFSPGRPRQTLTEVAQIVALDKGTVRRLLHTMLLSGLVDYDARAATYSLSFGVLELSAGVEMGRDLREVAAPFLAELAEQTHTTAFLWMFHENSALCTERVRGAVPTIEASWTTVGSRIPLNCGAGPRILLGFISDDDREAALERPLPKRTPLSQTSRSLLAREADRIRAQGWEYAADDFVLGLAALGAPIIDRNGRFVAALSISTLTTQFPSASKPRHLGILLRLAREIGRRLL